MIADFVSAAGKGPHAPLAARLESDPRVRLLAPGRPGHRGGLVVYWTQTARRARSNAALSLAVAEANRRGLPLLVYEAVRIDYPFASDRFHTFLLEGARAEAARYRARGAAYALFVPRSRDEARGVVARLSELAALIVTDDFPAFVVPRQLAAAQGSVRCPLLAVDDNAVVPLSAFPAEEYAARTLRPKLLREASRWLRPLEENTCDTPAGPLSLPFDPLDIERQDIAALVAGLGIDHAVPPSTTLRGGSGEAARRLDHFLRAKLSPYADEHNHPDRDATSGLSPYLHFGMIGAREVALAALAARAPEAARNAFLEQLLVRRGLAFNLAARGPSPPALSALPAWATRTLADHQGDARERIYSREQLEQARTGDAVWNAAQRELLATGVIHNYLRMLWGKGVMAWKRTTQEAFDDLVYLNDRHALDGRDPNSYTNILWCFGKHDRAWGPVRPVFGTVRYMSTAAAQRKLHMKAYLEAWSGRSDSPVTKPLDRGERAG